MIIGFSGKMGTGKTTTCKLIRDALQNDVPVSILSFGAAMKQECAKVYHFPVDWAYNNKDAEVCVSPKTTAPKYLHEDWQQDVSVAVPVRKLMQYYATDVVRREDPLHWVRLLENEVCSQMAKGMRLFLVDDVRFSNELSYIQMHGVCYRLEPYIGYQYPEKPHFSETALDAVNFDQRFWPDYGQLRTLAMRITERILSLYGL